MTRRDFLKGTAGFVLLLGAGFPLARLQSLLKAAPENAVGPLLVDGLDMLPAPSGFEVIYQGKTCFIVNSTGAKLLRFANGRYTLEDIIRKAGLEDQGEAVADFYITLSKAGYLQTRVEVNKVAAEM